MDGHDFLCLAATVGLLLNPEKIDDSTRGQLRMFCLKGISYGMADLRRATWRIWLWLWL